MFFTLNGLASPGTIPRGGVKGFKRETGWDIKKGKGTQGATLTLKDMPPCHGSFTLQLFKDQDFADWDTFVVQALSISPTQQKAQGLTVFYPAFSSIGLTQVVVAHYAAPEHVGKGLYHAVIDLIEWQPPPAASVVSTPSSTAPDKSSSGTPPDPRITQLQAQIGLLNQALKAPSQ